MSNYEGLRKLIWVEGFKTTDSRIFDVEHEALEHQLALDLVKFSFCELVEVQEILTDLQILMKTYFARVDELNK